MIELKHISAKTIVPCNAYDIRDLIEITGTKSVEDMLLLQEQYPEYDWMATNKLYDECIKIRKKYNEMGANPEIFTTNGYNDEKLLHQDSINNGKILMLDNPTGHRVRYLCLKQKTIQSIKSDLSHTFADGKNYLASCSAYRKVGIDSVPKITSAIQMYEEQIERQARLTRERDINLFELHQDEKMKIVEDMYSEIIMYLVYNTEEMLTWGKLPEETKKIYLATAIKNTERNLERRQKIKEYIANYTTLPELEKVSGNKLKVLKRFIVK